MLQLKRKQLDKAWKYLKTIGVPDNWAQLDIEAVREGMGLKSHHVNRWKRLFEVHFIDKFYYCCYKKICSCQKRRV